MVYLRICNRDDLNIIYKLRNDTDVRKNAFNIKYISYKEHYEWYIDSLQRKNRIMYLLINKDVVIGQIRLDIADQKALISYSIQVDRRGQGYGNKILELIKNEMIHYNILSLEAFVKKENIASRKAFSNNAFFEYEEEDYFKYIFYSREEIE